ncbi:nitrous oxide reductase family maturation protein NosD [Thermoproteota archaeon]
MKKVSTIILILLICFVCVAIPNNGIVNAQGTIYIRADGSVQGIDKIQQLGNVYSFIDNIDDSIIVEKDNIIIDGAGFTLTANDGYGVKLDYRHNVTIRNLAIKNTYRAIDLTFADDNTIVGNTIINSESAIYFWFSWRNNVTGNTISRAKYAFDFFKSPNYWSQKNVVTGNIVLDSAMGINLMESNNTFSDNIINSSILGVSLSGHQNLFRNNTINCIGTCFKDSGFDNDIDESNLVNGKPIIYWVGHRDETVPSDAGYVLLSNCVNINVQNLHVSGITIVSTTNSIITRNAISRGDCGVQMIGSSNNTVTENLVVDNRFGLVLTNCENNTIIGNNFSNNSYYGVMLTNSHYNTLKQNNISNNGFGGKIDYDFPYERYSGDVFGVNIMHSSNNRFIENNIIDNNQWGIRVLGSQQNNVIYQNNFIDNKVYDSLQVSMPGALMGEAPNPSIWDNGTRGNYWNDYLTRYPNAFEIDNTGVGDTPFFINENNIDHYPLMDPVEIEVILEFPSEVKFTPETNFIIPEFNGQVNFSVGGSYESAKLENGTWNFVGLALDSYMYDLGNRFSGGIVRGSEYLHYCTNDGNFSVSIKNCNITITNYDLIKWFAPYSGWLNYTVIGEGTQSFTLHYLRSDWDWYGPDLWTIYIDGVSKPQNESWVISGPERIITISGATNNVSIYYDSTPAIKDGPSEPDIFSNLPSVIIGFITSGIGQLLLVITTAIVGSIFILVLVLDRKRKSVEVAK